MSSWKISKHTVFHPSNHDGSWNTFADSGSFDCLQVQLLTCRSAIKIDRGRDAIGMREREREGEVLFNIQGQTRQNLVDFIFLR